MKMTRTQFKLLMKECLSELINEGMFDKHLEKLLEGKKNSSGTLLYGNGGQSQRSSNSGTPTENLQTGGINPKLIQAVKNVVSQSPAGKKNLFEEIMMDTALTTLQNQMTNGDGFGSNAALSQEMRVSPEVTAKDTAQLEAMAGGDLSRWALAAFGGKKKK